MNVIIANKYKIINELGDGAFGKVFLGENILTKNNVAIKIEKEKESRILKYEARIYNLLSNLKYSPKIRLFGTEENYTYLVLDLYDCSIDKREINDKKLLINIFQDCLKIIKELHDNGFIHRDIKPDNILFENKNTNSIKLIDYGLTKKFLDKNNSHVEFREGRNIIGTIKYCSINLHNGIEPSRRDDIESLIYTFIKIFTKNLPWDNFDIDDKELYKKNVLYEKKNIITYLIDNNIDLEFGCMINYIRNISYISEINYNYLNYLLEVIKIK